jgi:hypothetical protein
MSLLFQVPNFVPSPNSTYAPPGWVIADLIDYNSKIYGQASQYIVESPEAPALLRQLSRTFLQEIEAGTKNPTVNIITRIKVALNAKWEQLLGS